LGYTKTMSTRFAKQLVYAAFYIVVVVLIVLGFRAVFFHPAVSCFDGVQDQGETGIDCGGPCSVVCTAGAQPISVLSVNSFASTPGHNTFLAQVANPNADLAAQHFDYAFNLYDASGMLLQSIPGQSFLYAGQSAGAIKYLLVVNEAVASSAASINLSIPTDTITWAATSSLGAVPQLTVGNISTQVGSSTVVATGELTNNDTATFENVLVVAIFKDAQNNPIGASQTEIDEITPGQSEVFSVSYPATAVAGINPAATEIEVDAMRS
jgi:hypothetical protein